MLVLSRKVNEKIKIGESIDITIVAVSGDTVRLGIEAPREIKVLRSEVYEEIQRQNREAATQTAIPEAFQKLLECKGNNLSNHEGVRPHEKDS